MPLVFFLPFPPFFPRQEEWGQTHQARLALVFFLFFFHARRSGVSRMEHTRPDSPSIFSLFFPRQEGWHPHELHQARLALVFSLFFFDARRSGVSRRGGFRMERTRPDSPSSFPCFFPRQEWHPPQGWLPHGAHQARLALDFCSPFFPRQEWHPHGPHQARLAFVFFPLFFHVRWSGMAPAAPGGSCLAGLIFFSRVCVISPLEGRRRR